MLEANFCLTAFGVVTLAAIYLINELKVMWTFLSPVEQITYLLAEVYIVIIDIFIMLLFFQNFKNLT